MNKEKIKRGDPIPKKYKKLDTGEIVKVTRISTQYLVAEFSTGAERITESELRTEYEHLGNWN